MMRDKRRRGQCNREWRFFSMQRERRRERWKKPVFILFYWWWIKYNKHASKAPKTFFLFSFSRHMIGGFSSSSSWVFFHFPLTIKKSTKKQCKHTCGHAHPSEHTQIKKSYSMVRPTSWPIKEAIPAKNALTYTDVCHQAVLGEHTNHSKSLKWGWSHRSHSRWVFPSNSKEAEKSWLVNWSPWSSNFKAHSPNFANPNLSFSSFFPSDAPPASSFSSFNNQSGLWI